MRLRGVSTQPIKRTCAYVTSSGTRRRKVLTDIKTQQPPFLSYYYNLNRRCIIRKHYLLGKANLWLDYTHRQDLWCSPGGGGKLITRGGENMHIREIPEYKCFKIFDQGCHSGCCIKDSDDSKPIVFGLPLRAPPVQAFTHHKAVPFDPPFQPKPKSVDLVSASFIRSAL
ncbi:hypothetical protein CEXT_285841 [Caerostris extrusa]|uniref:Uncharacterized protein n=1 Tax=Caerostris extrusa TaxID=172846 RepID=A0AAV4V0D8_CAEEX|nr:hypothetical protein CEXT_285841 [Caerostris extrusa]